VINVGVVGKCHYTLLYKYMLCELLNIELHVLYFSSNVNSGKQIKGEERGRYVAHRGENGNS
jgi:hypothetical protein